jgi:hypothetical protein
MEKLELEVYSRQSNSAVIKVPGRQFPGVVIQDTQWQRFG